MWVEDCYLPRLLAHGQKNAKRVKSQRWISQPNSISPKELIFMRPIIYLNAQVLVTCSVAIDVLFLFIEQAIVKKLII